MILTSFGEKKLDVVKVAKDITGLLADGRQEAGRSGSSTLQESGQQG